MESAYDPDVQVDAATKEEIDAAYAEQEDAKSILNAAEMSKEKANKDVASADKELRDTEDLIDELQETVSDEDQRKTQTKAFFEWMRDNVDVFISEGLIPAEDRDAFVRDQERAIMQFSPEETYFYDHTNLGAGDDATNITFMKDVQGRTVFDLIRECIEKRKEDLTIEHSYSQQFSDHEMPVLRISSELMAAAELALNYSRDDKDNYHASVRECNEIYYGEDNRIYHEDGTFERIRETKWDEYYETEVISTGANPYEGWVDSERVMYLTKHGYLEGDVEHLSSCTCPKCLGDDGHYRAIVDYKYDTTGFSFLTAKYGTPLCNQTFGEQGKHYGLDVDTYELLFNRYYATIDKNALALSRALIDVEDKRNEKKYAEKHLDEWTTRAESAKADYESKYAAYQDLLSRYQKNDDLNSARTKANEKYEAAKKRTESARAKAERAASSLKDAESYLAKTKKNYAKALDTVKNAEEAYKTAVDNIDIVYRLYYAPTKEHLFTTDANERKVLVSKYGWIDENVAWVSPKKGAPVYRLFNPFTTDHHYTASKHESDTLVAKYGWILDGVVFHASDRDDAVAVRRLWNKGLKTGSHHFTTSANEYNTNVTRGWVGEDIAFRVEAADYIELDRPTDMKTYRSSNDDTITLTGTSKASKLSSGMKSGMDSSCRKESKASATKSSDAKTPKRAAATGVSLWAGISYIVSKRKRKNGDA